MTSSEMRAHERANIEAALAACAGKVFGPGGAAEMLDIKPTTLASRLKALGIANAPRVSG
jgi:transcriptional regulator with GAF, ATPase, and Fis domain